MLIIGIKIAPSTRDSLNEAEKPSGAKFKGNVFFLHNNRECGAYELHFDRYHTNGNKFDEENVFWEIVCVDL